jgi:hypothetical protein
VACVCEARLATLLTLGVSRECFEAAANAKHRNIDGKVKGGLSIGSPSSRWLSLCRRRPCHDGLAAASIPGCPPSCCKPVISYQCCQRVANVFQQAPKVKHILQRRHRQSSRLSRDVSRCAPLPLRTTQRTVVVLQVLASFGDARSFTSLGPMEQRTLPSAVRGCVLDFDARCLSRVLLGWVGAAGRKHRHSCR